MAFYNRQYFFLSFFLGGIQNDAVLDLINTVFHLLPQHILGRSVVSLYTVQLVFYISASLSLGETISTHLCLLKEHVQYSLLPGWLLHVFLYWGEEGHGEALPVWLFVSFLTKRRELSFSVGMLRARWWGGGGWSIAWEWKSHKGLI